MARPTRLAATPLPIAARVWLAVVIWFASLASVLSAQDETAPLLRPGAFVGEAECARCHAPQKRKLVQNPHGKVLSLAELHGCETCHGPGRAHADDDGQDLALVTMPPKLPSAQQEELCASCHRDHIAAHGGDIEGLRYAGKSCTDCHEIHRVVNPSATATPAFRSRADAELRSEPAGSASCIACHPLRDALLASGGHARLQASHAQDGCETCHGDGAAHVAERRTEDGRE